MKKIMGVLLVLIIFFTNVNFSLAEEQANFEIKIDGEILEIPKSMGKAHIDQNGRSAVPARAIIEALGFIVKWEGETQTVIILDQEENEVASLQIGSKVVNLKDGKTMEMDTQAVIGEDGRTYVPLRFVSEALNFEIPKVGGYRFENNTHYVNIVSPSSLEGIKETNLDEDIDYFNKTSLGEDKDKNDNYKFLESGELWYDFPLAMRNGIEKIKIGRTEDNRPLLYIGVWKEDSKDIIINLCQDIMKYYAKDDSDGDKIFTYVDTSIINNTKPDETKVMNFGNTTVGFGENDNTKSADFIISLDRLMFEAKSIEEVISVEDDIIVVDVSSAEVPHYEHPDGEIRIDEVGSSSNSLMGTYNGSSYEDDIALFNKALDGSTWAIGNSGSLQWASETGIDDPNAPLKIKRDNETGNPLIEVRTWSINPGDDSFPIILMTKNVFMEACKFYSKSEKDGESIFWFINKAFAEGTEVATGDTYLVGQTKIKIIDPNVLGFDMIFINDSNEVNNKQPEEVSSDNDENVIVIDISKAEVPRYQNSDGGIRIDIIGSSTNSMLANRPTTNTYEEDISLFNKALEGTTWNITKNGNLQVASKEYDDPNSPLKIKKDDKTGNPLIEVRTWDQDGTAYALMPGPVGMTMNVCCEAFKFYSADNVNENGISDGEAIYWYIDQAVKQKRNIASEKMYQFGQTRVIFQDPHVFGIDIIFVD